MEGDTKSWEDEEKEEEHTELDQLERRYWDLIYQPDKFADFEEDLDDIWREIVREEMEADRGWPEIIARIILTTVNSGDDVKENAEEKVVDFDLQPHEYRWILKVYLKTLSDDWLEEIHSLPLINGDTDTNTDLVDLGSLMMAIGHCKGLSGIPPLFHTPKFKILQDFLGQAFPHLPWIKSSVAFLQSFDRQLMHNFKEVAFKLVRQGSQRIELEHRFLEKLQEILEDPKITFAEKCVIFAPSGPPLAIDKIDVDELLRLFVTTPVPSLQDPQGTRKVETLKQGAETLLLDTQPQLSAYLQENIGRALARIFQPVVYTEQSAGILQVTGSSISLKAERAKIEEGMRARKEVRLLPTMQLLIDDNLEGPLWAGKNVMIIAPLIEIVEGLECTIDVSGQAGDSAPTTPPPMPILAGANGINGKDGEAGESGGNVHLSASRIINPGGLVIRSNGGRGGLGQPGGPGQNGEDGKPGGGRDPMTMDTFKELFPVTECRDNQDAVQEMEETLEELAKFPNRLASKDCTEEWSRFYEFETKSGGSLILSYFNGTLWMYQFVWYKGANGEEGGPGGYGGLYGRGGMGGYPGDVTVSVSSSPMDQDQDQDLVRIERHPGADGADGAGNGRDGGRGPPGAHEDEFLMLQPKHSSWIHYEQGPKFQWEFQKYRDADKTYVGGDVELSVFASYYDEYVWFLPDPHSRHYRSNPGRMTEREIRKPVKDAMKKTAFSRETLQALQKSVQQTKSMSTEKENQSKFQSSHHHHHHWEATQAVGETKEQKRETSIMVRREGPSFLKNIGSGDNFDFLNLSTAEHPSAEDAASCESSDEGEEDHVMPTPMSFSSEENLRQLIRYRVLEEVAVQIYTQQHVEEADGGRQGTFPLYFPVLFQEKVVTCPHPSQMVWHSIFGERHPTANYFICGDLAGVKDDLKTKILEYLSIVRLDKNLIENPKKEDQDVQEEGSEHEAEIPEVEAEEVEVATTEDGEVEEQKMKAEEESEAEAKEVEEDVEMPETGSKEVEAQEEAKIFWRLYTKALGQGATKEQIQNPDIVSLYADRLFRDCITPADLDLVSFLFNIHLELYVPHKTGGWPVLESTLPGRSLKKPSDRSIRLFKSQDNERNDNSLILVRLGSRERRNRLAEAVKCVGLLSLLEPPASKEEAEEEEESTDDSKYIEEIISQIAEEVSSAQVEYPEEIWSNQVKDSLENHAKLLLERVTPLVQERFTITKNVHKDILERARRVIPEMDNKFVHPPPGESIQRIMQVLKEACDDSGVDTTSNQYLNLDQVTSALYMIAEPGILRTLADRLRVEGLLCDETTLANLLLYVLQCLDEFDGAREETRLLFQWLLATTPQVRWMDELALLQLERNLQDFPLSRLSALREELGRLQDKFVLALFLGKVRERAERGQGQGVQLTDVLPLLSLLSRIQDWPPRVENELSDLELDYWTDVLEMSLLVSDLKSKYKYHGDTDNRRKHKETMEMAVFFLASVRNRNSRFIREFMDWLLPVEIDFIPLQTVANFLESIHYGRIRLTPDLLQRIREEAVSLETFETITQIDVEALSNYSWRPDQRSLDQVFEIIREDGNTSLTREEIDRAMEMTTKIVSNSEESSPVFNGTESDVELISIVDDALFGLKGWRLRETQKTAIVLLLQGDNILAEVATGEGKSIIVAVLCIIFCLRGDKCDVITSSPVLAVRDSLEFVDLFHHFGLAVGHNSSENSEHRKLAYSGDVVFGDAGNFQRDFLLTKYYEKNIFGERTDQSRVNVIIDEVDCLLLDNGNNVLYLTHQPGGLDALSSVFLFIWGQVVASLGSGQFPLETQIKEAVLADLHPTLTLADLKLLFHTPGHAERLFAHLQANRVICPQGRINCPNYRHNLSDNPWPGNLPSTLKDVTEDLLEKLVGQRGRETHVPSYLTGFLEDHLASWISSAIQAIGMRENEDYVVDSFSDSATNLDPEMKIIIIDQGTGVDLTQSQWSNGLHQFLQLKHGCALSSISLKAIFISNISYFRQYQRIKGMTGTLGSELERQFLKETYHVDYVTVPRAMPRRFTEDLPLVCPDPETWRRTTVDRMVKVSRTRSALVICSSVESVRFLFEGFRRLSPDILSTITLKSYTRSYETFDVGGSTPLGPHTIILATNLAGRGTNIKISNELYDAGGLFVCLTFLPDNIRIEHQAFGRTCRSGAPGSGQLIVQVSRQQQAEFIRRNKKNEEEPGSNQNQSGDPIQMTLIRMKEERDAREKVTVGDIKKHYGEVIQREEEYFDIFSHVFRALSASLLTKFTNEEKEIYLASALDQWAFTLDHISTVLLPIRHWTRAEETVQGLTQALQQDPEEFIRYPNHLLNLAKLTITKLPSDSLTEARRLFSGILKAEPHDTRISAATHYYMSMAILNETNKDSEEFRKTLRKSWRAFKAMERIYMSQLAKQEQILALFRQFFVDMNLGQTRSFTLATSFKKQQQNLIQLTNNFINSIEDITGPTVTPAVLSPTSRKLDEKGQAVLYYLLQEREVISRTRMDPFAGMDPETDFRTTCEDYGLTLEDLRQGLDQLDFGRAIVSVDMPSLEGFRDELLAQNIVEEPVTYMVCDPLIMNDTRISELQNENVLNAAKTQLLLYDFVLFEGILDPALTSEQGTTVEGFKVLNPDVTWQNSKEKKLVVKLANLTEDFDSSTLTKFDRVTPADFKVLFRPDTQGQAELPEKIFEFLVAQDVLTPDGLVLPKYIEEETSSLEWPDDLRLYQEGVIRFIARAAAYHVQLMKIKMAKNTCKPSHVTLASSPRTLLYYDLLDAGCIQLPQVKLSKDEITDALKKLGADRTDPSSLHADIRSFCGNFDLDVSPVLEAQAQNDWTTLTGLGHSYLQVREALADVKVQSELVSALESLRAEILKFEQEVTGQLGSLGRSLKADTIQSLESELLLFQLNGLDGLISLEVAKWTCRMLWQATACMLIGLVQFVVGIALEVISLGALTHVAGVLVSEGLGDMLFAAQAFHSGEFSWGDYWSHKWKSLITSVATAGVGALWSKGVAVSKFGFKLVGNTGSNLSKMAGKELMKNVSGKTLTVAIGKNMGKKLLRTVGEGVAEGLIDLTLQKLLNEFTAHVAGLLKGDVSKQIESLEALDDALLSLHLIQGPDDGVTTMRAIQEDIQHQKEWNGQVAMVLRNIRSGVLSGISKGAQKKRLGGSKTKVETIVAHIQKAIQAANFAMDFVQLYMATTSHLEKVSSHLDDRVSSLLKSMSGEIEEGTGDAERREFARSSPEFQTFLQAVRRSLDEELQALIEQKIAEDLESPLLNLASDKILDEVGSRGRAVWHTVQNKRTRRRLKKARQKYEQEVQLARQGQGQGDLQGLKSVSGAKQDLLVRTRSEFDKELIKCLQRTNDPDLFAQIVRSGPPASLIEVQAFANMRGQRIVVTGVDGTSFPTEFLPSSIRPGRAGADDFDDTNTIHIDLTNHHFTSGLPSDTQIYFGNDCLMRAMAIGGSPESNPAECRQAIAQHILEDPELRDVIRHGYHQFYLSRGSYGGATVAQKQAAAHIRNEVTNEDTAHNLTGIHGVYEDVQTFSVGRTAGGPMGRAYTEADHLLPGIAIKALPTNVLANWYNSLVANGILPGQPAITENDILADRKRFIEALKNKAYAITIPGHVHGQLDSTGGSGRQSIGLQFLQNPVPGHGVEIDAALSAYIGEYAETRVERGHRETNLLSLTWPGVTATIAYYEQHGVLTQAQAQELVETWEPRAQELGSLRVNGQGPNRLAVQHLVQGNPGLFGRIHVPIDDDDDE